MTVAVRHTLFKVLRKAWAELLFFAFMGLFLLIHAKDGALFVGFETIIGAACWAAGFRHRNLEHQQRVREIRDGQDRIEDLLRGQSETEAPKLAVVRPFRSR